MDITASLESRYVIYRGNKAYRSENDRGFYVNTRSTSKIFQVLPLYILGLKEKYALKDAEMVLLSSSHFGIPVQISVLKNILEKTQLRLSQARLPEAAPAGKKAYLNWAASGGKKSKIYHPCIGNHLAVMLLEREMTGSVDRYLDREGKAQRYLSDLAATVFDVPRDRLIVKPDYCGMANYYIPADRLALSYKKYGTTNDNALSISWASSMHRANIRKYPLMLEGDGGLATIISSQDGLIGKTGTGGLLAISAEKGSLDREEDCGIVLLSRDEQWDMVLRDVGRLLEGL